MKQSDKLYRFRSKSQHIPIVSLLGRRYKVKFSTPYNGLSRYSTTSEVLAAQIRKSHPFRNGTIIEEEPIENRMPVKAPVQVASEPEREEKRDELPAWMKRSVKSLTPSPSPGTSLTPDPSPGRGENEDPPLASLTPDPSPGRGENGTDGTDGKAVQGQMFGLKLDEVETYMDAKEYVREVLGADVTKKDEVKAYCLEHGVVFPNFSWD